MSDWFLNDSRIGSWWLRFKQQKETRERHRERIMILISILVRVLFESIEMRV